MLFKSYTDHGSHSDYSDYLWVVQYCLGEPSGSVIECLTLDWGAVGSSLTGVTALCPWAGLINPSLVLVQPRKTCPFITEILLMGCKQSNKKKQRHINPSLVLLQPRKTYPFITETFLRRKESKQTKLYSCSTATFERFGKYILEQSVSFSAVPELIVGRWGNCWGGRGNGRWGGVSNFFGEASFCQPVARQC